MWLELSYLTWRFFFPSLMRLICSWCIFFWTLCTAFCTVLPHWTSFFLSFSEISHHQGWGENQVVYWKAGGCTDWTGWEGQVTSSLSSVRWSSNNLFFPDYFCVEFHHSFGNKCNYNTSALDNRGMRSPPSECIGSDIKALSSKEKKAQAHSGLLLLRARLLSSRVILISSFTPDWIGE